MSVAVRVACFVEFSCRMCSTSCMKPKKRTQKAIHFIITHITQQTHHRLSLNVMLNGWNDNVDDKVARNKTHTESQKWNIFLPELHINSTTTNMHQIWTHSRAFCTASYYNSNAFSSLIFNWMLMLSGRCKKNTDARSILFAVSFRSL